MPILKGPHEIGERADADSRGFLQRFKPRGEGGRLINNERFVWTPCRAHLDIKGRIGGNGLMVFERIHRIIGRADDLDLGFFHQTPAGEIWLREKRVAVVVNAPCGFGIEQATVDSKVTRELDVRPMVERVAQQLRHGSGVLLELFPRRRIAGAETLVDSCRAHRPPLVVVATKPKGGHIVPAHIVRNLLGRQMAMIVDNRQIGRVAVVKLARGGCVEKKVLVDERA